jgi:hypothetical protein
MLQVGATGIEEEEEEEEEEVNCIPPTAYSRLHSHINV